MDRAGLKHCMIRMRTKIIDSITRQAEAWLEYTDEMPEQEEAVRSLLAQIEQRGLTQTIEKVAVLWFTRFIMIRFMEVNEYLDNGVRLLSSSDAGENMPDCIRHVSKLQLELDYSIVSYYLQSQNREELYHQVLLLQFGRLAELMPNVFDPLPAYAELLVPTPLLGQDSILQDLIVAISEVDWRDVEILGWLYQYFIYPRHEEVVGINRGTVDKEDIPVATQLFTPRWIAQYLLQNTLGRRWVETGGNPRICMDWEYYLEPSETYMSNQQHKLSPEELTVLDPCVGTGHILIHAFDLLYTIYLANGYQREDIPYLILEKNLFGFDIDEQVISLARFALLMKGRRYCADIIIRQPKLNLFQIKESPLENYWQNQLDTLEAILPSSAWSQDIRKELTTLMILFQDASNLGSLIQVNQVDWPKISRFLTIARNLVLSKEARIANSQINFLNCLANLVLQAKILHAQYEIVVTNPPYLGPKAMNDNLKQYLKLNYERYTQDVFAAFIKRNCLFTRTGGIMGFMTPFVWMYIKTYSQLRKYVLTKKSVQSLIQLEYGAYEDAVVPVCTFVLRNSPDPLPGVFLKLSAFKGAEIQPHKVREARTNPEVSYRYERCAEDFLEIPGCPIAFWISEAHRMAFRRGVPLGLLATPKQGLATADNSRFLRLWHEVAFQAIAFECYSRQEAMLSGRRWFPYNKGGDFRKWYGNNDYIINWENDGEELRQFLPAVLRNQDFYFRSSITWSFVSSARFGVRYSPPGFLFDVGGSSVFLESSEEQLFFLALLCSKVTVAFLDILNPTINFQVGNIAALPVIAPLNNPDKEFVCQLAAECIALAQYDWNCGENSWDFRSHPLLIHKQNSGLIADAWAAWEQDRRIRIGRMQYCEEQINRIFIRLYGLEKEMSPAVTREEITLNRPDCSKDIRSFLSYAVGCMFGRYSLDEEGLVYAGGLLNPAQYRSFPIVQNNVIPVTDDADEVFSGGDIVNRLVEFVQTCFGKQTLEMNLTYIAQALRPQKNENPHQTIRRYYLTEFYQDHLQLYKKRPIYWLFDAGRNNSFKALAYLHRYQPDLVKTIQTQYLKDRLRYYERKKSHLDKVIHSQQLPYLIKQEKRKLETLLKKIAECSAYNLLLNLVAQQPISLNLDDGVVRNYAKFQNQELPSGQTADLLHSL